MLLRVDFNVPLHGDELLDDSRITSIIPTLKYLERAGVNQVTLVSHLGRPQGREVKGLSLRPVAKSLSKLIKRPVKFLTLRQALASGMNGEPIRLLENIRFEPEEDTNDRNLARLLAQLGDIFVNDAFSVCHHAGASTVAVTRYLPSYAGLFLQSEVRALEKIKHHSSAPLVLIIGGSKVADKLPVIQKLLPRAQKILVGGLVANTFLAAQKKPMGKSGFSKELVSMAAKILKSASRKIILPQDVVVDIVSTKKKEITVVETARVKSNQRISDLGAKTINEYAAEIKKAKTILWAGTLGIAEEPVYAHASLALGRLVSGMALGRVFALVGGGDTVGFFHQHKLWVDYFSLAGGASLKFLAGERLPGVEALKNGWFSRR